MESDDEEQAKNETPESMSRSQRARLEHVARQVGNEPVLSVILETHGITHECTMVEDDGKLVNYRTLSKEKQESLFNKGKVLKMG